MASRQLVINSSPFETRIAYLEEGQLTEYYSDRKHEKRVVGSIFKGRVTRVLPGMQSCFVDIGLERSAFLYGGDIIHHDNTSYVISYLSPG
jgi:ribonuclease G